MEPLDPNLNVAILNITSRLLPAGFDVFNTAPATYEALKKHLDPGGRMIVLSGRSETTIYADAHVNHAFRAWHDFCHWRGCFDLTAEGERAACAMQCDDLCELYGDRPEWRRLVHAEVVAQAEYFKRHRRFPSNQRAFVETYLNDPNRALLWPLW
jgi:hypothetical protein